MKLDFLDRFNKKICVDNKTQCWNWVAGTGRDGYGAFNLNSKTIHAHRVAWVIKFGFIPKNICVLHRCDNKKCVNPGHLFLGSRADNMMDKVKKNRQSKGIETSLAKLTEDAVVKIRLDRRTNKQIGKEYKVHRSTIGKIKNRTRWKHVD